MFIILTLFLAVPLQPYGSRTRKEKRPGAKIFAKILREQCAAAYPKITSSSPKPLNTILGWD